MSKRELARQLVLNGEQLMPAIGEWIDHPIVERDGAIADRIRQLCAERARLRRQMKQAITRGL